MQSMYILGIDSNKSLYISQHKFEKRFGQSSVFISSMLLENGGVPLNASPTSLLKEAIHVISCGYEEKTDWGKEVSHKISKDLFSVSWNSRYSKL